MMIKEKPLEHKVAVYNSDVVVDILRKYGIEYVSTNIGSTFRGLWDSLVNYGGDESPKCISCCHEEIAVAIAHGYAKAAGKPMIALLHDTVGLQHGTMAIYNAWCDRVPMIILSATGPMDTTKRRPWIDWVHTSLIPNELVRNYVKWDDFPFSFSGVPQSLSRAYNTTVTDPTAPVFVCFDAEYLEDKVEPIAPNRTPTPDLSNNPPSSYPPIDSEYLERVANLLLEAENPFIVASGVGRDNSSVKSLVDLAEASGARVYDTLERFNFPNTHPLDAEQADLTGCDVVLSLDTSKLEQVLTTVDKGTRRTKFLPAKDARIVKIGLDELLMRSWAADYQGIIPSELSILANTANTMPKLTDICRRRARDDSSIKNRIEDRISRARESYSKRRNLFKTEADRQWNDSIISLPRLAGEVWSLVKGKSWVIASGDLRKWVRKLWDWEEPGCYLGSSGGAGLGYCMPASIGAALALKNQNKIVINFQPDGDMLFTSSALWTAAHYHIPLLTIMFNNRLYYNDAEHNKLVAMERGRDAEVAFHNGGDINDPPVDFAKLAQAQGVYGEGPIEKPDQIRSAVERAIRVVEAQREPALVDVVVKAR
jgi:thiamine pyrophosphate-dependent acetolactate synthase large subunit-like protein